MLTRLRAGAFALAFSSSLSNSGMPDAARVARGPGEMARTRMPLGSSSADTYLTALSSAALWRSRAAFVFLVRPTIRLGRVTFEHAGVKFAGAFISVEFVRE